MDSLLFGKAKLTARRYCTVLVVCFGLFVYGLTSGVAAPSQIMSIGLGEANPAQS